MPQGAQEVRCGCLAEELRIKEAKCGCLAVAQQPKEAKCGAAV